MAWKWPPAKRIGEALFSPSRESVLRGSLKGGVVDRGITHGASSVRIYMPRPNPQNQFAIAHN